MTSEQVAMASAERRARWALEDIERQKRTTCERHNRTACDSPACKGLYSW